MTGETDGRDLPTSSRAPWREGGARQAFLSAPVSDCRGDWRTIYDAIFTDWKGKRRKMPLGSEVRPAKDGLALLEARNINREDFDAAKIKPDKGMTVVRWADAYLDLGEIKTKRSFNREGDLVATIKRLLGPVLLTETATPSFAGVIQRSQRDRILDVNEEETMLDAYPRGSDGLA